jgi:Lon protease-like protein
VKSISHQTLNLPTHAPVMVLPDATLFPTTLMPLHIFEPRYRAMLAWALERQRMFCVALMKSGVSEAKSVDDFYHTAGLGLVRACVQRADGTSNLVLQGLARVQFSGFLEERPFRIAQLREIPSQPASQVQAEALATKLLELCGELRKQCTGIPDKLEEQLARVTDPEMLGDVIAHTFLRDPQRRQQLLEEQEVGERLRALIRHLREQIG